MVVARTLPPERGDFGHVAELVDALDLGSSGATRQSSSLCLPTNRDKGRSAKVPGHV